MASRALALLVLLTLMAAEARAQVLETEDTPRVAIGGSVGLFRISLDEFTQVYNHRVGPALGGSVAVRVLDPYFLMVAARTFQQNGKTVSRQTAISWSERWINVGVRRIFFGERVNSFVGFGLAFFRAAEDTPSGILRRDNGKRKASGFFLDFGVDLRMTRQLAAFLDLELTSASAGGLSGFEASSIGGFYFSGGLHVYPF